MKYDLIAETYVLMTTRSEVYLSEDMLMEDRIDTLKQMYSTLDTSHDRNALHHLGSDIVDHFAQHADPTNNKVYTHYLLSLYKKKAIKQEDAPRIKEVLSNFDRYKQFLPSDRKQLNPKTYPNISDIHNEIIPHLGKPTTNKEAREQLRNNPLDIEGHRHVYSDRNISTYNVSDEAASQKMYASATASKPGAFPTEWCTAWMKPRECQLNRYRNIHGGEVYSIHHHPDKTVYQYHTNTNQFMNAANEYINDSEWEKLRPSIHKMWDEHPSMLDDGKNSKPEHLAFLAKYGKAKHINSALDRLLASGNTDPTDLLNIHKGVAENKFGSEENYNRMVQHPKFNIEMMAGNRTRNPKFLSFLSKHQNPKFRALVAKNPRLPQEDLDRLSRETGKDSDSVRAGAIKNPNASIEHINRAIDDPAELVRIGAVSLHGHKLPTEKLNHIILNDQSDKVIMNTINTHKNILDPKILEHLRDNHQNEHVRFVAEQALKTRKQNRHA